MTTMTSGEGWDDQSAPGSTEGPPQRPGGGSPSGRSCLRTAASAGLLAGTGALAILAVLNAAGAGAAVEPPPWPPVMPTPAHGTACR